MADFPKISRSGRKIHLSKRVTDYMAPYHCGDCTRQFKTSIDLKRHSAICGEKVTKEHEVSILDIIKTETESENHDVTRDGRNEGMGGNCDIEELFRIEIDDISTKPSSTTCFIDLQDDLNLADISKDFYVIPRNNEKAKIIEAMLINVSNDYLLICKSTVTELVSSLPKPDDCVEHINLQTIENLSGDHEVYIDVDDVPEVTTVCDVASEGNAMNDNYGNNLVSAKEDDSEKTKDENEIDESCNNYETTIDRTNETATSDILGSNLQCQKCGKMFKNDELYQKHTKRNCTTSKFACDICNKTFKTKLYFTKHVDTHYKTSFDCIACDCTFDTQKELNIHINVHNDGVICALCYRRLKMASIVPHFARLHPGFDVRVASEMELAESRERTNDNLIDDDESSENIQTATKIDKNSILEITDIILDNNDIQETTDTVDAESLIYKSKTEPEFSNRNIEFSDVYENPIEMHATDYKYGCSTCGKRFRDVKSRDIHFKKHNDKKVHKCGFCEKTFTTIHQKRQHEIIHTSYKQFSCCYCDERFKRKTELHLHITGECTMRCDFVMKISIENKKENSMQQSTENNLMHVTNDKEITDEKIFVNNVDSGTVDIVVDESISGADDKPSCTKTTINDMMHSSLKDCYPCPKEECEQWFYSASNLTNHIKQHNCVTVTDAAKLAQSSSHLCQICGKSYRTKILLTNHLIIHSGIKPFICDICDRGFADRGNLAKHKLTHTTSKSFICDECGKAFKTNTALKIHALIHVVDRPFKCDECTKCFKTRGNFIVHKKRHAKLKPQQCQFCNYSCLEANKMKRHEKRHIRTDIVQCDICTKIFKDEVYLKCHMANVHNRSNEPTCDICGRNFQDRYKLKRHQKYNHGWNMITIKGMKSLGKLVGPHELEFSENNYIFLP